MMAGPGLLFCCASFAGELGVTFVFVVSLVYIHYFYGWLEVRVFCLRVFKFECRAALLGVREIHLLLLSFVSLSNA